MALVPREDITILGRKKNMRTLTHSHDRRRDKLHFTDYGARIQIRHPVADEVTISSAHTIHPKQGTGQTMEMESGDREGETVSTAGRRTS